MDLNLIQLSVKAILGSETLRGDHYSQLRCGDILVLNQKVEEPVALKVEDLPKFKAFLGLNEIKKAAKLT